MDNKVQENFIAVIREKLPQEQKLVNYLEDKLILGRESVYRRLRGEIPFTFAEVMTLSLDLKFSVDNIIGAKKSENALYNIHMLQSLDYVNIYKTKILEYGKMFREVSKKPNTQARMSINTLPYYFHIKYENLSRFRIYKWLHQNQKIGVNSKFTDFELPDGIMETHQIFYQDIQKIPDITIIMDNNIFWSAAKDIEYFFRRGLLNEDDLQILKNELLDIVDMLEEMATKGVSKGGAKVSVYYSSIDLEASYLHLESDDWHFSQLRVFSISAIDSFDDRLCQIQKEWIDSLKKYSVLISQSGEIQRFEYMNKQRGYINKIPNLDS
jgi:hypothetical protein